MRDESFRQMPARRRVLIIDDHPLVRRGLTLLIDNEPDLTVCAAVATLKEGLEALPSCRPDLVITELSRDGGDALVVVEKIRSRRGDLPIMVLTMHDAPFHARRALLAGASGYVTKHETTEALVIAIRLVLDGEKYVSPEIQVALDETGPPTGWGNPPPRK